MSRRIRRVVIVVVVLVIAGAVAAVLLARPDLANARDRVDARWLALREPLAKRYTALNGVAQALHTAGATERAVTRDLDAALAHWNKLALHGPAHSDPGGEATTANELEALARRVRANYVASGKLSADPGLKAAIDAFDLAVVSPAKVMAYNTAVRHYEDTRSGIVQRVVAGVLGYESRSVLLVGG
jgi:hypothetical protein